MVKIKYSNQTWDEKENRQVDGLSMGGTGASSSGQPQVQLQEASLTDVKVGIQVMVWGAKNGERITAEVIYIQSSGRQVHLIRE